MPSDILKLSQEVLETLRELRGLFSRLGASTLGKIPLDAEQIPSFGREVASMVVTLNIHNRFLLRRVFRGDAVLGGPEPSWFADAVAWVRLPDRQPRARIVERKLRMLLENLNQQIGCLDDETLMQVPPQPEEIPEFLTLSIMVQSHLAWYLDVYWFPRTFKTKPG